MFLIDKNSWKVKKTKNKGFGIFAKKTIKKGTVVGDYLGRVIKIAEYNLNLYKKGLYLMFLNDEAAIYPDLKKPGIHLFNHSCEPNCFIYSYRGHTLFFALKNINAGEELTISYLIPPKDKDCNPCTHVCRCRSESCTGTMHTEKTKYKIWQKFQNEMKKKTETAKFVVGKNLPKLKKYPIRVPGRYIKTLLLDLKLAK